MGSSARDVAHTGELYHGDDNDNDLRDQREGKENQQRSKDSLA